MEQRRYEGAVDDAIAILLTPATDKHQVEAIAKYFADERDPRAIRPLLARLCDREVQEDAEVEDTICRALMALGVMCPSGERSFKLRPRPTLSDDVVATIRDLSETIPWPYFGNRQM